MSTLYDRYGRLLYTVAKRIVGNSNEAEEIVQEVFLKAWTRAHSIRHSVQCLRPWLSTVTRNQSIDHLRAKHNERCEFTNYESIPSPSNPPFHLAGHEPALRLAFAELPEEQRTVIEFAYFQGLSQSEISERMGRPLGTVKTWTRTALLTLRRTVVLAQKS